MKCDGEVMAKAAAALGYSVTLEELERLTASVQELDPDEMVAAGGVQESVDQCSLCYEKDYNCDQLLI